MGWTDCRSKYTDAKLDERYIARRLEIPWNQISERLHDIKGAMGLRGRAVSICLDDGEVYMPDPPYSPIGNLLD